MKRKSNIYCRGLQFFATPDSERMQQIETRLAEIRTAVDAPDADLTALETEVTTLTEERTALHTKAEKRAKMLQTLGAGSAGTQMRSFGNGDAAVDEAETEKQYRHAWLNNLRNVPLSEAEKRAFTTASDSAGPAIPTTTANTIIQKVEQFAPMLSKITLLRVPGAVKFAVEDTYEDAAEHTQNGDITGEDGKLVEITLSAYEITKLVQISKSVQKMSVDAFETWLTTMLARKLAQLISKRIINGSGTNQATGIEKANTWGASNSVTVGAATSLTKDNVLALIGLLNGGYDSNAAFLMSKKTLFTDFMPLQNASENDLVTREGSNYFIYGYPVLLDDNVTLHEAYLGDYSMMIGNLAEDITITSEFETRSNSFLYLGCCMFDCIPSVGEAFVKLAKATA